MGHCATCGDGLPGGRIICDACHERMEAGDAPKCDECGQDVPKCKRTGCVDAVEHREVWVDLSMMLGGGRGVIC